jgi:3-deoxy-D-manno-octulosonic-acid transferase
MFWYKIYKQFTQTFAFLVKWHIESRLKLGKEDTERYTEKFGIASKPRPDKKVIWFHAASVGELNSILPLINDLIPKHKTTSFLVTTGTVTSAKIIEKAKLERTIHQFVPVDTPQAVEAFLKHWKPDLAIFVESEIWPNLLVQTSKKTDVLLLNARLSDNSFRMWRRATKLAKFLLAKFTLILPSTKSDMEKISYFVSPKKLKHIGNLKYAAPKPYCNEVELKKLQKAIGKRPIWLASSTHKGEEEEIIKTHLALLKEHRNLLTIILPRHPNRGLEILDLCSSYKASAVLRSTEKPITEKTGIYIADSIGEIGIFYTLANIVFVGGSLINHGGQNILEPARSNCAIVTGVHTFNFKEIVSKFLKADAIQIAQSQTDLLSKVSELLGSKKLVEKYSTTALTIANEVNSILDETVEFIGKAIKDA